MFGLVPVVADAADGADGIFQARTHRDYSASGAALAPEGDIDPEPPERRLRAAQVVSEDAGIFRPSIGLP
jgi:hypothetical protein